MSSSPPLTPPSVQTVESSGPGPPASREYLPDVEHEVFKHFSIIKREEGKAQQYECKYCFNVFSGAAIRCAQHLTSWKKMKRREVSLCKEALADVRHAMKTKYEKKAADAEERRRSTEAAIAAVKPCGKRARITDYLEGDAAAKKREAHLSLALMFAGCHIPEQIVDHPLFVNAIRDVARAGDGYVPPVRKFIGGTGLQACRRGIESGLVGIKASWKRTGVTLASDMMTDRNGRPQANVFLVNDVAAVLVQCVDCNMEKKTGGYIAGLLKHVIEEVGPENIVAICTDGGSNYAVACQQLIAEWPHIQHVPCATHVLDLLMEDVGKLGWAKKVVDRTTEMSSFVRNHHWTRGYLRTPEMVGGAVKQALKPAGTRFGTRMCELRNSLTQMVLSDLWKEWAVGERKKAAEGFAAHVLDAAWWKTAEFFAKLMKLPYMAMRRTDGGAKGMMGRMYGIMLQLTEDVEAIVDADEEHLSNTDKQQIRRILKNMWDGSLACAMHVAGRILNPANQEEDIFGGDAECTRVFKAFISSHAEFLNSRGGNEGDDECDYLLTLGNQLRSFLDLKGSFGAPDAIAQWEKVKAGTYSMVNWWQWNGTDAPQLSALAVQTLSQPVSASPCERGWSSWESVHTARRNRLGSAKCADVVYVTHNWNVVRGWHTRDDVMRSVVRGNEVEPPIPAGYNISDEMEEEEGPVHPTRGGGERGSWGGEGRAGEGVAMGGSFVAALSASNI
ncbi:unnamed protein product [Closterium sp. Naga37s-1]|nr:unnamed protein product [Closterium sp. Naga37s-1]